MTVLLCLGDSKLCNTGVCKILAHCVSDLGGIYQELIGDMKVAVILKHTCETYLGNTDSVKLIEALVAIERLGDLDGAVAAEVEENYAIAVLDGANGLAVLCNNEGRKILVKNAGDLSAEGGNSLLCRSKSTSLAQNVSLPASFNHAPVCFVSVHGNVHTSAAGSDTNVEVAVSQVSKECLEGTNVFKGGCRINVTTVDKDMNANGCDALCLCLLYHSLEVVDM